jgi:hypothetical protein
MTHDPLCWTHVKGLPDLTIPCDACEKIAMIRVDERRKSEPLKECESSPNGLHGKYKFTPKAEYCGWCGKNVSYLFEMGR